MTSSQNNSDPQTSDQMRLRSRLAPALFEHLAGATLRTRIGFAGKRVKVSTRLGPMRFFESFCRQATQFLIQFSVLWKQGSRSAAAAAVPAVAGAWRIRRISRQRAEQENKQNITNFVDGESCFQIACNTLRKTDRRINRLRTSAGLRSPLHGRAHHEGHTFLYQRRLFGLL